MIFFLAFLIALAATMILIPPLTRNADVLDVVDAPNGRKIHLGHIPRIGGIAMVTGSVLSLAVLKPGAEGMPVLLLSIAILVFFGIWDDRRDLDFRLKFFGQIIAISVAVIFGQVLMKKIPLGGLDAVMTIIAAPFTIFCLVGVTNAFNLADGLDGLAGGVALLSLAAIAFLADAATGDRVVLMAMAVAGCILGFLRFNTHPAKIFMGDTGSQFLGYSSGVLSILLTQQVNPALSAALPLLLLGFPIFDTAAVMIQRLLERRSPFSPDKNHIHHRLLMLGFDHYEAVIFIYLLHSLFILAAITLRYESDLLLVTVYVAICITTLVLLRTGERMGWKAHGDREPSFVRRLTGAVRNVMEIDMAAVLVLQYVLPIFFIASAMLVENIPRDIAVLAALFFVSLFSRLLVGYKLWFLPLRLMIFITAALIVYITGIYEPGMKLFPQGVEYVFYGLIILVLLAGIRFSGQDVFRITPTDILLVLLALGIAWLPEERLVEYRLVPSIVKTAILFYAIEFVIGRMKDRWNFFTGSMLAVLAILAVRGLA